MPKTILVDAWETFVTSEGVNEDMQKLLDEFENKKIIVTNANEEEKVKFGIVNMPYEVFSLEHNPNKTDPMYFQKLMENYSLKPEDIVYFEHAPEAVESAKSLDITSFYYDKDKKDLEELKKFLKDSLE